MAVKKHALLLFSKPPVPGMVKTRLTAEHGGIFNEYARGRSIGGLLRGLLGGSDKSPMLIQFAGCRAEESSIGYPIGGTWTTALLKVLAVDRHISWRSWFDQARSHPSLTEQPQPQWFEVGPVTDGFRSGEVFT